MNKDEEEIEEEEEDELDNAVLELWKMFITLNGKLQ